MQYSFTSAALGALASVVILSNACNAVALPHSQGVAARFDSVAASTSTDSVPRAEPIDLGSLETRATAVGGPGIKVIVGGRRTVNVKAGSRVIGGPEGGFYTVEGGRKLAIKEGEQQMAVSVPDVGIATRAAAIGGPGIKVTVSNTEVKNIKAGSRVLGGTTGGTYTVDGGKKLFTIKAGEQQIAVPAFAFATRAVAVGGPGIKVTVSLLETKNIKAGSRVLGGITGGKYTVDSGTKVFTIKAGELQIAIPEIKISTRAVAVGGPGIKVTVSLLETKNIKAGSRVLGGITGGKYTVDSGTKVFTIKAGELQIAIPEIKISTRAVDAIIGIPSAKIPVGGPGIKVTVSLTETKNIKAGSRVLGGTTGGKYTVDSGTKVFTIKAGEQKIAIAEIIVINRAVSVAVGGPGIKVTVSSTEVKNVKAGSRVLGGATGGKYTVEGGKVRSIKAGEQQMALYDADLNARRVTTPPAVAAVGGPGIKVNVANGETVNVKAGSKVIGGIGGGKYTVEGGKVRSIRAGEQQMALFDADLNARAVTPLPRPISAAVGGPGIKVNVANGESKNVKAGSRVIGGTGGGFYTVMGGKKHPIKAGEQIMAVLDADITPRAVTIGATGEAVAAVGGPGIKVNVANGETKNVRLGSRVIGGIGGGFYSVVGGKKYPIKEGQQIMAIADSILD